MNSSGEDYVCQTIKIWFKAFKSSNVQIVGVQDEDLCQKFMKIGIVIRKNNFQELIKDDLSWTQHQTNNTGIRLNDKWYFKLESLIINGI